MISVLSPGDFGAVVISQAITIDGGAVGGTITFTGTEGISVTAGASDTVILRHLVVNGINSGSDAVYLQSAAAVIIEDCDLEGFTNFGLAIASSSAAMNVTVNNTRIIGGAFGVRTFQTINSVPYYVISMRHVVVSGATTAAVFTRNGTMEISDSLITQSLIGVEADTNAFLNVANSVISNNGTDEIFYSNTTPGGGIFLADNNTFFGNNGSAGPPVGPALRTPTVGLNPQRQPPPDTLRHRQQ